MSNQKIKIPWVFADVFEFSSVLEKNERFSVFRCFTDVFECFFEPSSKWRFSVIFRIVKKPLGFVGKLRTRSDEVEKSIWELEKKGTFFGADFLCSRITYISTLRLERLYESCNVLPLLGRSPFQGWAPGRAAKIRLARRWRYFSGIFGHFRHHARTFPRW